MINANCKWKIEPNISFANVSNAITRKAMRIAINAAAAQPKAIIQSNTPTDTGILKKAMRIKVINYKNSSVWVAVIGASTTVTKTKKVGKKKVKVIPAKYQKPINILTHFMDKSADESKQVYINKVISKLREVLPNLIKQN